MPSYRSRSLLIALSTAAVATTLSMSAGSTAAATTTPAPLTWTPCAQPDGPAAQECATLPVPLDYRDPTGPQLSLAVSRIRSDRPDARRGVLMVLPGGPGGSGVQQLAPKSKSLLPRLKGAYDLVALDPRGVGGSTRASCQLPPADRHMVTLRSWPGPDGRIDENIERSRRTADLCARNGGAALRSFTSANQARDMDLLRIALGERKISTWSVSYGAYVGAVYAQKFPHRTDRWVLDSIGDPDPARVAQGWMANTSQAVEDRFPDFAKWAADPARDKQDKLRLAQHPYQVRDLFLKLAARLDHSPMESTTPGVPLTGNRLRQSLHNTLNNNKFEPLATTIQQALKADPEDKPVLAPEVAGPLPDEDAAITMAVICNDVRWPAGPGTVDAYRRNVAENRARFPLTAGLPANITPCSFWKWAPAERPTRITSEGPSNVLLVQNRRDPATPYFGALKMRAALGDRARMITVEDPGGHGAYLKNGNACGDDLVTTFLTTGKRPAKDTYCTK
ncbi:alpha/beta hydrolase [Streptomyces sp. NPDC048442]|uniref:alpha/beta hydrolase n=1 Tax=Streptomyces sp. NPDC048442 TaxID=3154823 RepID=UPI00343AD7B8